MVKIPVSKIGDKGSNPFTLASLDVRVSFMSNFIHNLYFLFLINSLNKSYMVISGMNLALSGEKMNSDESVFDETKKHNFSAF